MARVPSPLHPPVGLYNPQFETDACGLGFVADLGGVKTHNTLRRAVHAVVNLTHRGAVDADARTGDGAGVLAQVPFRLFEPLLAQWGTPVSRPADLGVGMLFLPLGDELANAKCRLIVEEAIDHHDLRLLGWREVPVDPKQIGDKAAISRPDIQQVLFTKGTPDMTDAEFDAAIYLCRRVIERSVARRGIADFYVPSFSRRVVVYKGMFVAPQLDAFFADLQDPLFETALAVFHQRYSTNTMPEWRLAHPFRMLCHNGEINTLTGNLNWMRAREPELSSSKWGQRLQRLLPIIQPGGSDSAALDNTLEAIVASGRDILHAITMLVPEAWEHNAEIDEDLRAYFRYHSCLMEPWDGPAGLVFTDGDIVGATLDRGGLRPARYKIFDDNTIVLGSEVGILNAPDESVVEKGRLGPGRILAVDTKAGHLLRNDEIKRTLARRRPWRQWLADNMVEMPTQQGITKLAPVLGDEANPDRLPLVQRQLMLGYNSEEVRRLLVGMFREGKEAVGSMGDDTPLALLSKRVKPLHHFFKQRFAQVTNPPIDPIREEMMLSVFVNLGRRRSLFEESPEHARMLRIGTPVLTPGQMRWLMNETPEDLRPVRIPILFDPSKGEQGLEVALQTLCAEGERQIGLGRSILLLSDAGISKSRAAIPSLLAVGALHHHLIRAGLRERCSILLESGEVRDTHSFAACLGYGASAIYPYLVYEQLYEMCDLDKSDLGHDVTEAELSRTTELLGNLPVQRVFDNFVGSMQDGILKIMAKMGISTLSSYIGAQVFEAVGIDRALIDRAFAGTPSLVGGVGLAEIAANYGEFHAVAVASGEGAKQLPNEGLFTYSAKGEYHAFNPSIVKSLQKAVRENRRDEYLSFARQVNTRPPTTVRDLLRIESDREPIDIDDIEPAESIVKRFATAAMSYGSLSLETHMDLAIAMNRIGGKSNSGEGGEERRRYRPLENGDFANSAVKQIASARFGVTPEYLINAKMIEIKMAQGSKPGEGGQLPGHKVSVEIAAVRHSTPGVTLISPPPHHDIYSIEDLAQLIYDLKTVNPRAKICVKLVAEAGVGTIAAGVAKAGADLIHIAGHDGGTGASPLSSIKHAGSAWEIGLAEAQQVLMLNDLRGRVTLRVDGGLKTGRDVLIAALLGAEEYVFGTAALVALGCVMARQCHTNKCPVGVATQDPALRAKYPGKPEHLVAYMHFIAAEVRQLMAGIGYDSVNDLIGRVDLLRQSDRDDCERNDVIDLAPILVDVDPDGRRKRRRMRERYDRQVPLLDDAIIHDARDIINHRVGHKTIEQEISNIHRTVGAGVAGEIAFAHGDEGLGDGEIEAVFRGTAGQSFGAFCINGLSLNLIGEANDYVGKSMAGGEIAIRPPKEVAYIAEENTIIGNTALYGATGGHVFVRGQAGERFAVRNSGARAVVEGLGDHGCEYMTGGVVVVLGETGRNFGAGMTGGIAYVYDRAGTFSRRVNRALVGIHRLEGGEDTRVLRIMLELHRERTESELAARILENWDTESAHFWKVVPFEVARLEQEAKLAEAKGAGNVRDSDADGVSVEGAKNANGGSGRA